MQKKYTSLGLMSGTSGDGVDSSIIHSNGIDQFEVIKDKYFEYDSNIYNCIHSLKEKIFKRVRAIPRDIKIKKIVAYIKRKVVFSTNVGTFILKYRKKTEIIIA